MIGSTVMKLNDKKFFQKILNYHVYTIYTKYTKNTIYTIFG
jgi:hypothetical protein